MSRRLVGAITEAVGAEGAVEGTEGVVRVVGARARDARGAGELVGAGEAARAGEAVVAGNVVVVGVIVAATGATGAIEATGILTAGRALKVDARNLNIARMVILAVIQFLSLPYPNVQGSCHAAKSIIQTKMLSTLSTAHRHPSPAHHI